LLAKAQQASVPDPTAGGTAAQSVRGLDVAKR
jgi:hypothetical protein